LYFFLLLALTVKDQKEKKIQAPVQHHSSTKTKPRVSEEQKEKLKEDLREMLQKIQAEKWYITTKTYNFSKGGMTVFKVTT